MNIFIKILHRLVVFDSLPDEISYFSSIILLPYDTLTFLVPTIVWYRMNQEIVPVVVLLARI